MRNGCRPRSGAGLPGGDGLVRAVLVSGLAGDSIGYVIPPAARLEFDVACIYYPDFHPTPSMGARLGFGWSEWDIARRCRPRFEGHRQPILPTWGPFDESDPAWSSREIAAAPGHGIDAWIFDWYRYSGVEIWNEALDSRQCCGPKDRRTA